MTQQLIGVGTVANDGTGDPLRTAFIKVNANETQLYNIAHPGYVVNNWYIPIGPQVFNAGNLPGANNIILTPGYIANKLTISNLGLRITTIGAAGNVQAAIYAHNAATGRPGGAALVTTTSMSTGTATNVTATASVQLDCGWYWFAICMDNSTAIAAGTGATSYFESQYAGSATLGNLLGATSPLSYIRVVGTFGTWPNMTGQTFAEPGNNNGPLVAFQVASIP